ncbi:hypothetical protein [Streptomyces sp. NBC_01171]|uniref:hypothetical protein n=1 Tax=Streptomyces sp. NBC_01171 TaxID=2903757 RepID=UPI0038634679|nr:hypothetical protein OG448_15105 [Streptomyces sp. NBC_01171]
MEHTDAPTLRDHVADALRPWLLGADEADVEHAADAVLAKLPPPVDRATVLREAADALDESDTLRDLTDDHMADVNAAANELRRMADEASR